jgi:aspartyl-tRNA(Asn)/glutamyl-tRNA(Gln) amidotransferase subunit C
MITKKDVEHAAKLARIELRDDEVGAIQHDLERIVGYVDVLMKVDVDGVEPMTHPPSIGAGMRDDEVRQVLGRDALSSSAGFDVDSGLVKVPRVID